MRTVLACVRPHCQWWHFRVHPPPLHGPIHSSPASFPPPTPIPPFQTGIERWWLKADLQRAMEAKTVPDCSHSTCSECGVCSDEFGDNGREEGMRCNSLE